MYSRLCPLLVTGSGGESTFFFIFFRVVFALLTVTFTFSLFIIISPPSPCCFKTSAV